MKVKKVLILIGLIALVMVFQPVSVRADVSEATVVYLQDQDQNSWITQALVATGATNISINYLASVSGTSATDYAKAILALAAVGENPATFGNEDYVAKLKGYYQDGQMGDLGLINDDIWSIIALASVGEANSTEATAAKDYLLANQNSDDDGWGYSISSGSDTDDTAAAIIALAESGMSASDAVDKALAYLRLAQNNDGGFGCCVGSESNTNSTSWAVWAIKKLGQSPDSDFWSKGSKTPLDFIKSMQNSDGSFGRTSNNIAPNVMATQDAVIALSGTILPLGYFQVSDGDDLQPLQPQDGQLRIEGPDGPICNKFLTGTTAYDLLVAGEIECGYTFIGNRDWGTFFLDSINDIENSFPASAYWMYLVNNDTTYDGLEEYILQSGDEILIYYDIDTNLPPYPEFDRPLRIVVDNTNPEPEEDITITVEYYNQSWLPAEGATALGGDQNYQTDASGQVVTSLPFGYYILFAQKDQFIRSNQEKIMVLATDQIVATPIVEINTMQTEVVITSSQATAIAIPSTVTDATINVNALKIDNGNEATATLPEITLNVTTNLSATPVEVIIPADTVITAITAPASWDGIINVPRIEANDSVVVEADSGYTAEVCSVIEIGCGNTEILFNKAVRILIPGAAGKLVGYSRGGNFTKITAICSPGGDALDAGGDCTIDSNDDLVIWTKHFTKFVTYTQTVIPPVIPQTQSGGSTFFPATDCQSAEYDEWQDTCVDGWQYRNVLSEIPSGCKLTEEQENQRKRQCIKDAGEEPIVEVLGIEFILDDQETEEETAKILNTENSGSIIINKAELIASGDVNQVILAMNVKRDLAAEVNYNKTIVAKVIADSGITAHERNSITNFVAYGTDGTMALGAGERAGAVNSYRSAFGKLPATEAEWNDCLKIANGYLPNQTNADAENKAAETFKRIYLRDADRFNANDDLAVKIMAYGLRPADRDLDKEKAGLKIFQGVYGYNPFSATDWDYVRAIAYSGATR
ncbi:DUF4430 domain-containing protein [Candidatus Parcubacteria bacterium]|nr:DUF4430 domain-containing protein [Candidatus Parcubacteria bacterium]